MMVEIVERLLLEKGREAGFARQNKNLAHITHPSVAETNKTATTSCRLYITSLSVQSLIVCSVVCIVISSEPKHPEV